MVIIFTKFDILSCVLFLISGDITHFLENIMQWGFCQTSTC